MGQSSYGHEDFACRSHGTADIDGAAGSFGFSSRMAGGSHIDLPHPALLIVKLQAMAVAAEGVGKIMAPAAMNSMQLERNRSVSKFHPASPGHLEVVMPVAP
jgi:hypothetical protein